MHKINIRAFCCSCFEHGQLFHCAPARVHGAAVSGHCMEVCSAWPSIAHRCEHLLATACFTDQVLLYELQMLLLLVVLIQVIMCCKYYKMYLHEVYGMREQMLQPVSRLFGTQEVWAAYEVIQTMPE